MAILGFAFQLFVGGHYEPFGKLCRLLGAILNDPKNLSEQEYKRIKGEMALLLSFKEYNDIVKMSDGHKEALALLDSSSMFMLPTASWTFSNVSVLICIGVKRESLKLSFPTWMNVCPLLLQAGSGTWNDRC